MARKTTPPRVGAVGSVPPGGNPNVAPPPIIQFDDDVDQARKGKLTRNQRLNRQQRGKKRGGVISWLVNFGFKVGVFYLLIGALWSCGSQPFRFDYKLNDSRSHCRALAQTKLHLQPIVSPYVDAAHAKVQPYTQPYLDAASPYAKLAWKNTRPYYRYASKQGKLAYNRHVEPARKLALKRGRAYVDPHVKTAQAHYKKQIQPHVNNVQRAVKPWQDVYRRDVAPYLSEAYVQSLAFGSASYGAYVKQVHPRVVSSIKQSHGFYVSHIDPAVRRVYALYLRPQVDKVLAKVFGHRAHALGSDALKNTTSEVKQSRQHAKELKKERVAEAKASASRAQEDPTLIDRLNKAKDHVVGGPLAAEDPVASATSDAELEVETISTKEQLEAWEKGLAELIEKEYELVVERLNIVRSRFADNLPERFNVMTEDVEVEVEGIFGRLTKSFEKLQSSSKPATEKVAAGREAVDKQKVKLERSRGKAVDTIGNFHKELQRDEYETQKASVAEVERYVLEAQKAYQKILKEAKFEKIRTDWKDWDNGMGVRTKLFDEELDQLRKGSKKITKGVVAIDAGQEGDIQRQISKLQQQIEGLYDTALAELGAFSATELAQLGGQGATAAAGKVLESIVEGTKQLSSDAQGVVEDAAKALKGDTGDNVASILSSKASTASASASSLARQGVKSAGFKVDPESPGEYLENFTDSAKDGFASLTKDIDDTGKSAWRRASQAAGLKPTPESAGEYVEAAAGFVKDGAAYVAGEAAASGLAGTAAASSLLRQATRSAASVVGATVKPETPEEYLEVAREGLASAADSLSSAGQKAIKNAQGVVGASGAGAGSQFVSDASAAVHSATRSAASFVGVKPTPETAAEYVEAAGEYVESVAGVVSSAAGEAAGSIGDAVHSATRSAASVAGVRVTPETAGEYVESVAEYVSSAADSAREALAGAAGEAGSAVHSATRSVASAVGVKPTPETAGEYVEAASDYVRSAAGAAGDAFGDAVDAAGSAAHSATRSLSSLAGVKPTPETVNEYVEAVGDAAGSAASVASSAVLGSDSGSLASSASSVVSSLSSVASSAFTDGASSASSIASGASRSVVKAAGGTPEPEGIAEHVESVASQVRSVVGSAAESVVSSPSGHKGKIRGEL